MKVPVPVNGSSTWTPSSLSEAPNSEPRAASTLWMMKSTISIGRVDDAEAVGDLRERRLEEPLVELGDDPLPAFGVVDALGPHPHAVVELVEASRSPCQGRARRARRACCCMTMETGLCSAKE